MAYEVTATRRRPQRFDDLVGQEFVAATLKNAIQSGKIAHAYLFSGPRGCGKTSSARILAKALNCEHGPTATPCEECTQCKEITKGASLDVIEIDGASNTSVNDIRQIKDEVLFPPNSSRYKIYIIDEVHMLSTSAFNALLKTIEEPPEYVIFIFATTELHKVPATIKSRCQQFHFRLGTVDQIKDVLAKAAEELHIQADDEALFWIARESTGSFRDAYTLFDQVVAFSDDHITYDKIKDKLGLVGIESLNELSEACIDGNSKSALEKLDEITANGVSIENFVSNYADYLRSLLLIQSGITKEALLGQNVERYSKKVLSSWNRTMLERALSLMFQLYRDLRYSLSPRYELELAVSRLCWLTSYVSVSEVKQAIDQAKNLLLQGQKIPGGKVPEDSHNNTMNSSGSHSMEQKHQQNEEIPGGGFSPDFLASMSQRQGGAQTNNLFNGGQNSPFQNSGYQKEEHSAGIVAETENPKEQNDIFLNPHAEARAPENSEPFFPHEMDSITEEPVDIPVDIPEEPVKNTQPALPVEDLKKEIVSELELSNPILGSLIMQTNNWLFNDGIITLEVETPYLKNQVEVNLKEISQIIKDIWGRSVKIQTVLKIKKEETTEVVYPDVVNLLCDDFRGSVVQVTKSQESHSDKQPKNQIQNNDSEDTDEEDTTEEDTDEF